MSSERFKGKTAIVTGAASGVGRALGRLLAREGANVFLADWNAEGVAAVAREIGARARSHQLDISDSDACDAMVEAAVDWTGQLDIVANVAAVIQFAPLDQVTPDKLMRILGINVGGAFYISRAAMPHLIKSTGNIVNVASVAGLIGIPYNSIYVASKHALVGMTKALALEFADHGVRINAICPTAIKTPMLDTQVPEGMDVKKLQTLVPWLNGGAYCEPEDVADAVAYLASSDAKFITGVAMPVDGGLTAV